MDAEQFAEKLRNAINPKLFSYPYRGAKVEVVDKGRVALYLLDKQGETVTKIYVTVLGDVDCLAMAKLTYNTKVAIYKALGKVTDT